MIDLRAVIPAAAAWLAALVLLSSPPALVPVALLCWTLGIALVVVAASSRNSSSRNSSSQGSPSRSATAATAGLAVVAIALVATSAAVQGESRRPAVLEAALRPGVPVQVTVVVTQTVATESLTSESGEQQGTHFRATLTSVDELAVSVPVRVFDGAPVERAGIGTTLALSATLSPTDDGGDISYLLFATEPAEIVAPMPWQLAWADSLRAGFASASEQLPGDGGTLLPGLAIGDTGRVDDRLDSHMKTSSLSHLTAVSGANCAIVVGLIMLVGAAAGLPRWARVVASLAVLAGFVVLVTPEPSVLRAALMAALVLVFIASGRPVRGLPVLACAVVGLLVLDPWLSRSFGFVLSVLATAGLLVLAGPIARLLARWMPLWIAAVIAVPLAAQLACQPVLVLLDASLPLYGVIANMLAAPAAPLATVIGLAACLVLPVAAPVGQVLAMLAWLPAAWIAAVASFFAGLPLARVPWPGGGAGATLLAALTVGVIVLVLAPLSSRSRRAVAFGLCSLLVVALSAVVANRVVSEFDRPGGWQYAACDVGQGDAMVVRSAGTVAVIDTGREPGPLAHCLESLGIGRVALLVLTHFDLDHVGGYKDVLGRVDSLLIGPSSGPDDDRIVQQLADAGARVQQASKGESGLLGELRWRVLWPLQRGSGIEPGNDASIAMVFEPVGACATGCISSLFLGDLGEEAQRRMLAENPFFPAVDLVKVSHHGSSDQDARVYERASAAVALIGVGTNNYGHPHETILGILASAATTVGRTDQHGLVLVSTGEQPGTLTLWTERSSPETRG